MLIRKGNDLYVVDAGAKAPPELAKSQVLLRVKPKGGAPERNVVVVPITLARESSLRYDEWEYTRRLAVEMASQNKIGYVPSAR